MTCHRLTLPILLLLLLQLYTLSSSDVCLVTPDLLPSQNNKKVALPDFSLIVNSVSSQSYLSRVRHHDDEEGEMKAAGESEVAHVSVGLRRPLSCPGIWGPPVASKIR